MSDEVDAAVMTAAVRNVIENHEEWDSFHQLLVMVRDPQEPGGVKFSVMAVIDPAMDPALYGTLAGKIVSEAQEPPPYALLLQFEGFSVRQQRGASAADKAQLNADRVNRNIHTRPDAREQAVALLLDVHGRTWTAVKDRESGAVEEEFCAPGDPDMRSGGRFLAGLRDVLRLYGEQA